MPKTSFEDRCGILAELWMQYREQEGFEGFIQYNDISLPLAYMLHEGIVEKTDKAEEFIEESFLLLIELLEIEDTGFDTLDDILTLASQNVGGR